MTIEEARKEFTKSLLLRMEHGEDEATLRKLDAVGSVLKRYAGPCPVFLAVRDPNGRQAQLKLGGAFGVNPAALKLDELEMILGPGGVLFAR